MSQSAELIKTHFSTITPENQMKWAWLHPTPSEFKFEDADKISRVTFWGLHDGISWRNYFPIQGRTDYPLVFDREMKPKKAYFAIVGLMEERGNEYEQYR